MRNIFVTEYRPKGTNLNADVMVFTEKLSVEELKTRLTEAGDKFNEAYEVPQDEVENYSYEPCWL